MAKKAKVKSEFKHVQIGFNNSGVPLGLRDDLDLLAAEAIRTQDPYLLGLFEVLPSEEEAKENAGEKFLKENPVEVKK